MPADPPPAPAPADPAPRRSPLGGRRPRREELAGFAIADGLEDVLPAPGRLRLLIVGINPGLWTAAVNAPFARPGNRFWPSLHAAGLTVRAVDASRGLAPEDAEDLTARGVGITNLVARATARADELRPEELRAGAERLRDRLEDLSPAVVALAGITAYRTAFDRPRAAIGPQDVRELTDWPAAVGLWVLHQPSGLNAHATVPSLAADWRAVAEAAGVRADPGPGPGADAAP